MRVSQYCGKSVLVQHFASVHHNIVIKSLSIFITVYQDWNSKYKDDTVYQVYGGGRVWRIVRDLPN